MLSRFVGMIRSLFGSRPAESGASLDKTMLDALNAELKSANAAQQARIQQLKQEYSADPAKKPRSLSVAETMKMHEAYDAGEVSFEELMATHAHNSASAEVELARNEKVQKLEKAGKIEMAIEAYLTSVSSNPQTIFAHGRLAIIYNRRKEYSNEIAVSEKAIEVIKAYWPDPVEAIKPWLKRIEKARAAMDKAKV